MMFFVLHSVFLYRYRRTAFMAWCSLYYILWSCIDIEEQL